MSCDKLKMMITWWGWDGDHKLGSSCRGHGEKVAWFSNGNALVKTRAECIDPAVNSVMRKY